MKKSILLKNGDVELVNGRMVLISKENRIRQLVENTLSIKKGEWFLNKNTGLSHDEIHKKSPNIENLKTDIISCLSELEEVVNVNILDFNYDPSERKFYAKLLIIYTMDESEPDNDFEMEVAI
ncbi:MAG: hypothetical protein K9L56_13265 [Clostridiales bacterium]|nr:hypothetical protein [Clostridiales bacterium]